MKNTKDVQNISISLIDPYPGHPFKVTDDEKNGRINEKHISQRTHFPGLHQTKSKRQVRNGLRSPEIACNPTFRAKNNQSHRS